MKRALRKTTILVVLVGLLASMPMLGCGAKETVAANEVIWGLEEDLTGRASFAVVQMYDGLVDYMRMVDEENLLPDVKVKLITYDTKGDPARIPAGYMWLKGQGMNLFSSQPQDSQVVEKNFVADKIHCLYTTSIEYWIPSTWYTSIFPPSSGHVQTLMHWIMSTWDYSKGKPNIGVVLFSGIGYYEEPARMAEAIVAQFPDKFGWIRTMGAPTTTTSWVVEATRLMDADFILPVVSGAPLAGFVKEVKSRGFKGTLLSTQDTILGYWGLVKASVAAQDLDGVVCSLYQPWWDSTAPIVAECKAHMQKYRTQDKIDTYLACTGYLSGWIRGLILTDVAKRAAEKAGTGKLDSLALHDAILETNLTVEGFGAPFRVTQAISVLSRTFRIQKYGTAEGKWVSLADWYTPPLLGGQW